MKKLVFILIAIFHVFNDCSALMWNDPGVNPVQSISDRRWRDGATGRLINVKGMPDGYVPPANVGTTPAAPAVPTTPATPTASTGTNTTTTNPSTTTSTASTPAKKGMIKGAKVGTALMAVSGAAMVYSGTAGQQEHDGWDLVSGVGGGAMTGAAIGSVVPVIGTVVGTIVGAVGGGLIAGSQLFSETDCLYDPIIRNEQGGPTFTCCNTAFNKGERYAKIGDYMFCDSTNENGQPYAGVRQCLQGGAETELDWWDGLWEDDAWTAQCQERWCNNNKPPHDNVIPIADTENFCWKWQLADDTSTGTGGTGGNNTTDPYAATISKLQSAIRAYEQQCGTAE